MPKPVLRGVINLKHYATSGVTGADLNLKKKTVTYTTAANKVDIRS